MLVRWFQMDWFDWNNLHLLSGADYRRVYQLAYLSFVARDYRICQAGITSLAGSDYQRICQPIPSFVVREWIIGSGHERAWFGWWGEGIWWSRLTQRGWLWCALLNLLSWIYCLWWILSESIVFGGFKKRKCKKIFEIILADLPDAIPLGRRCFDIQLTNESGPVFSKGIWKSSEWRWDWASAQAGGTAFWRVWVTNWFIGEGDIAAPVACQRDRSSVPTCSRHAVNTHKSDGYNSLHFTVFEVNPNLVWMFFFHESRIRTCECFFFTSRI